MRFRSSAATAAAALFAAGAVESPLSFTSDVAPEEAAAFMMEIVILGCLGGVLVVRMIPLDRLFVHFLRHEGA